MKITQVAAGNADDPAGAGSRGVEVRLDAPRAHVIAALQRGALVSGYHSVGLHRPTAAALSRSGASAYELELVRLGTYAGRDVVRVVTEGGNSVELSVVPGPEVDGRGTLAIIVQSAADDLSLGEWLRAGLGIAEVVGREALGMNGPVTERGRPDTRDGLAGA